MNRKLPVDSCPSSLPATIPPDNLHSLGNVFLRVDVENREVGDQALRNDLQPRKAEVHIERRVGSSCIN
jgi:hypothetical protein